MVALALLFAACSNDDSPGSGGSSTDPSTTLSSTTLGTTSLTTTASTTDETGTSGDPSSDSTAMVDSSTGEPVCPDTHVCVPMPDGWNGPVLVRLGTEREPAEPCPESYPTTDGLGGTDLVAPPATCGCSCGEATEVTCALSATLRYYGDDASCGSTPLTTEIFTTACNILPATFPPGANWVLDPVLTEGGSCLPESTMEVEDAAFATTALACSGAELLDYGCDSDDNQVCAPRVDDEALCVWQDGDASCPEGYERRASTYHRAIEDARGCAECGCGEPQGLCDDAFAYLFSGFCNGQLAGLVTADAECHASSGVQSTQSAAFDTGTPSAFCAASEPTPSGEAVGAMPVTVCCR